MIFLVLKGSKLFVALAFAVFAAVLGALAWFFGVSEAAPLIILFGVSIPSGFLGMLLMLSKFKPKN